MDDSNSKQKFVLDCSTTMAFFFKDETSTFVDSVFETLAVNGLALVPPFWPLEVTNACLSAERRKRLTEYDRNEILSILGTMPIHVIPYSDLKLMRDILALAQTHNLSAYDASYLELAKRECLPLVTLDKKLKKCITKENIPAWIP